MGTLSVNGLHGSFKQQWTQIKTQSHTILKNNYSEQQFKLISVPLTSTTNLKPYFSRQIFFLPKTPKVIVLEKQKDKIFILVEHPQAGIVEALKTKNCQLSILLFLRDICSAVHALKKKYQPFLITQKMIKMCKNQNILVWFNQKYESNLIQLPLQKSIEKHEQIMIQSIINIFLRYSKRKPKILTQKFCNFIHFKEKIQNQISLQQECTEINKQRPVKSIERKNLFLSQKQINDRASFDKNQGFRNSLGKKQRRTYLSSQKQGRTLVKFNSSKELKIKKNFEQFKKIKNNLFSSQQESSKDQNQRQAKNKKSVQKKFKLSIKKINQKEVKIINFSKHSKSPHHKKTKTLKNETQNNDNTHFIQNVACKNRFSSQSNTQKEQKLIQVSTFKGTQNPFKKKTKNNNQDAIQFQAHESTDLLKLSKGSKNSEFTSVGSFSRKNYSLKSTAGTVRKTRQFQEQFKFTHIQQEEIIKQQSDQTHKNSMSLSQDLDKLFPMSGKGSIQLDQESEQRQQQFQKLLFN